MADEDGRRTLTIKVGGWLGVGIYAACGMLYHLLDAEVFSWADPWLYVTIFLWPLFLLGWFIVIAVAIVALVVAVLFGGDLIDDWKRKRRRREWEAKQAPATVDMYERSDERRRSAARQSSED